MTIQQLRYVIKITECGSITEAARQLFVSQPSLSAAVKELEAELGIEIFRRTAKGITLTADGTEFLSYVRQIIDQTELLEERYMHKKPSRQLCRISTQHYAFAVNAFVAMISSLDTDEYELTLRETRTYEIIEDVASFQSELGILYLSNFNEKVLRNMFKEKSLTFTPLFEAKPHVFISSTHPLAGREEIDISELDDYPCLVFEQGTYNSFYFFEEILSTEPHKKRILVSDRATLFNLLIGLNGYTTCTGVLNRNLNGDNIVAVRLRTDENMLVGYITSERQSPGACATRFLEELKRLIAADGFEVLS